MKIIKVQGHIVISDESYGEMMQYEDPNNRLDFLIELIRDDSFALQDLADSLSIPRQYIDGKRV